MNWLKILICATLVAGVLGCSRQWGPECGYSYKINCTGEACYETSYGAWY